MNVAKAREHFSAYYEGTLDRGLKESFERAMNSDAQIAAEYRAFRQTYESLADWGTQAIAIPEDLHERISARVDLVAWQEKQKTAAPYMARLKGWILAGLATAALALVVLQFGTPGDASMAGIGGPGIGSSGLDVRVADGRVLLSYPGLKNEKVTLRDEAGKLLETLDLNQGELKDKAIENPSSVAQVLSISVGDQKPMYIALPGTARGGKDLEKGSLLDLARSFAGFYRTPVVLAVNDVNQLVEWRYETDEVLAVTDAIDLLGLQAELRSSGVLWIQSH